MQHAFIRPRLILAALAFGAAAFLGSHDGWTAPPRPAGYPNPSPLTDSNGNLAGNVLLTMSDPYRHATTGTRVLSFQDLINPTNTTYKLFLWLDGDATPTTPVATFTKTSATDTTKTYTAVLHVNDNPNNSTYSSNRFWNWRVDVTTGTTTTGTVWKFRVPLEAPTDGSTDVSVYCKFQWENSSVPQQYTPNAEAIFILDPNNLTTYPEGFYSTPARTAPNTALVNKAVNLVAPAAPFYGTFPNYREFWIHDSNYVFNNYPRLEPGMPYQWAVWYTLAAAPSPTVSLNLLQAMTSGETATFTITDHSVSPAVTATMTLNPPTAFTSAALATAVQNAIASAIGSNANITGITVTNTNLSEPTVVLTWPVSGVVGLGTTISITSGAAYLNLSPATTTNFTIPNNPTAATAYYGPTYSFTTVGEPFLGSDSAAQGVIVYWQHPQGSLARDPDENVTSFYPLAYQLAVIHENDLEPVVHTYFLGTEELAASYGGLDQGSNQNKQEPFVPDITSFPGWYTIGGASAVTGAYDTGQYAKRVGTSSVYNFSTGEDFASPYPKTPHFYPTQDRYSEWVAKGIRTWLQDAANQNAWGTNNDHLWFDNLQYVVLLGDAERVAPSFYYYYQESYTTNGITNYWLPTDLFYMTQSSNSTVGANSTGTVAYQPQYIVSRIPMRQAPYITVNQTGATFPPSPSLSTTAPYYDPLPFLSKIRDYCDLMNSTPTDTAKTTAFNTWFRQVVMVNGSTEYYKWFQFFPGFAQYLVSLQVQDQASGVMRDAFSGMLVRQYDLFGTDAEGESLTLSNILGRMSIDNGYDGNSWNASTADTDVPGFVYLLARGGTDFGGASAYGSDSTAAGGVVDLTPSYDPTYLSVASPLTLTTDSFPEYIPSSTITSPNPVNFPTPTTKARPVLVSPANVINRYDNSIWGVTYTTLGESAVLAQGGPIAVAGFSSGRYLPTIGLQYTRTFNNGAQSQTTAYTGTIDENEGYEFPTITQGTADLAAFSTDTDAVIGKIEIASYFAQQYGTTTSPVVGVLFNHALAAYIAAHLDAFTSNYQRETTTAFGAELLGDCAVSVPGQSRAPSDYARPKVTDTSLRAATAVSGYSPISSYNSQNMPVNVISHYTTTNTGATVTLQIQTDAPYVRVRVFTPFEQNYNFVSGWWVANGANGATDITSVTAVAPSTGVSVAANELVCATSSGTATVQFNALTPSIYLVIVQAQNPVWTDTYAAQYSTLQERWFYLQAVNQFVRQTKDSTTGNNINLLVVDVDQHDRYYLNGEFFTQHDEHLSPTHITGPGGYYWDTMVDTYYVDPTWPDGAGYDTTNPPADEASAPVGDSPALPYINSVTSNQYEYQFWCANVYHSLATNGPAIAGSQRYYGDITPDALLSFQTTGGCVLWFTGDFNFDFPAPGYLFQYDALDSLETSYLTSYVNAGGRLWMDSDDLVTQSSNGGISYIGAENVTIATRTFNASPFAQTFLSADLGAIPETLDTQYTSLIGLQLNTMSQKITDIDDIGGDGRNNLHWGSEINPNTTILSQTVFTWDTSSGTGTTTGSKSGGVETVASGKASGGGQTIFFTWPLESINHLGNITDDTTGRAFILKAAIDWLTSVPKPLPGQATNLLPANGATADLLITLSWTAGLDATSYKLSYGLGSTLPSSPIVVTHITKTSYLLPKTLIVGDTYTWRLDSVNANGTTLGTVQSFTVGAATTGGGGTGTTGSSTGTTSTGGGGRGSCFIATAGYESSNHSLDGIVETNCTGSYVIAPERLRQLNAIRALRDDALLHFSGGRAFSAWYYAIGPYGATAIRDNEPAKAAVRVMLLNPLAALSRECAQAEK